MRKLVIGPSVPGYLFTKHRPFVQKYHFMENSQSYLISSGHMATSGMEIVYEYRN